MRSGWRRFGWVITLAVVALLVLVFLVFTKAPTSTTTLSINNAQPNGARAVAEILRQHGIDVTESSTLAAASKKLGADGTLVIAGYAYLDKTQIASIVAWHGPVLWLAPSDYDLSTIVPNARTRNGRFFRSGLSGLPSSRGTASRHSGCSRRSVRQDVADACRDLVLLDSELGGHDDGAGHS